MQELLELCSILLVHRANMQNLHWNAQGLMFDETHKDITSDYYDDLLNKADEVAEMLCRLGINPPNYSEVLTIINESSREHLIVSSDTLYGFVDIVDLIDVMFKDILESIEACLNNTEISDNIKNVGIKASLESMYNEFDLQCRYINNRRTEKNIKE